MIATNFAYTIPNVLPFTLTGDIPYEYNTKNRQAGIFHTRYEKTKTRDCPFVLSQAARKGTK